MHMEVHVGGRLVGHVVEATPGDWHAKRISGATIGGCHRSSEHAAESLYSAVTPQLVPLPLPDTGWVLANAEFIPQGDPRHPRYQPPHVCGSECGH